MSARSFSRATTNRATATLIRASNYVLLVLALMGGSIVKTRNVFFYVALLVVGFIFPVFAVFIASCLMCWAYTCHVGERP